MPESQVIRGPQILEGSRPVHAKWAQKSGSWAQGRAAYTGLSRWESPQSSQPASMNILGLAVPRYLQQNWAFLAALLSTATKGGRVLGQSSHCLCPRGKGAVRGCLYVSAAGLPLLGMPGHPQGARSPRPGCCCCPSGSAAAPLSRGWAGRAGAGSRGGRAALWRQRARILSLLPAGRRNTATKQIYGMVLFLELLVLKGGEGDRKSTVFSTRPLHHKQQLL